MDDMACTHCGGDRKIRCDDAECFICAQNDYCANAKTCDHCTPKWEYRDELKIQGKMREVVKMTIEASEKEIEHLRRKVKKLTYGS